VLRLRKLDAGYDPRDRLAAMTHIAAHEARGEILTGLLYVDAAAQDLHAHLKTVETPLNRLADRELCPGAAALESINAELS
jgi:2-oxoglutarate ferredoxin oxidoreductase subunit beta